MKSGNWVPVSKGLLKYLPIDRVYTKLEATFSLQVSYYIDEEVTVAGLAALWKWSRKKVRNFLRDIGIKIIYPAETKKIQNQKGQIRVQIRKSKGTDKEQIRDRSENEKGQIRFINNKHLQTERDRSENQKGQIRNRQGNTTIENKNKKKEYSQNSDEFRLSQLLFSLIKARRENFKKPDLQKWAINIDYMMRLDKRDVKEIEAVIKWTQQHEFWRNVILSTKNLRGQFDRLALGGQGKADDPLPPYYKKIGSERNESTKSSSE